MTDNLSKDKPLEAALHRILQTIQQDSFGGRAAPQVRLRDGSHVDDEGTAHGAIEVYIAQRNGEEAKLHEQSLDGVTSIDALKDTFAEALSIVLSKHTAWPR